MSLVSQVVTYAKSLFHDINLHPSTNSSSLLFSVFSITEISESADSVTPEILAIELEILSAGITNSPKIQKIFKNPLYSENLKLQILLSLFPGLSIRIKALLLILTERKHLYLLPQISSEFLFFLSRTKKQSVFNLTICTFLPEQFGKQLLNQLRLFTKGKDCFLKIFYNPRILGGVIIDYDSLSLDLSIFKEFSYFFTNF